MTAPGRKVLITGCSDGGMGAALALAFHRQGLDVYATARDPNKMKGLASAGIKTLVLDVQSESSIAECVAQVPALDILVNNAGAVTTMPIVDIDISKAKELFDLNVWSYVAVTQAFLPLLLKSSDAMIVNQTSTQAVMVVPFAGVYNSSKAAISMITQNLRLELQPFGIKVVEMKTGDVQTKIIENFRQRYWTPLPEGSIYSPAKDTVEYMLERFDGYGPTAEEWANSMVKHLTKTNPTDVAWSGVGAWIARGWSFLPSWWRDKAVREMSGLDTVEKIIHKESTQKQTTKKNI